MSPSDKSSCNLSASTTIPTTRAIDFTAAALRARWSIVEMSVKPIPPDPTGNDANYRLNLYYKSYTRDARQRNAFPIVPDFYLVCTPKTVHTIMSEDKNNIVNV